MPKKSAARTTKKVVVSTPAPPAERQLTIRVSAKNWRRIKDFALDEDATIKALFIRGISALMVKRGKPPLDED